MSQLRFDSDALRKLAGDKTFARGEAYFREGSVSIIRIDTKRVLAQVSGTEDYRCVLSGRGTTIDGECSCPAFSDFGFCKHLVATGLAANAAGADAETDGSASCDRIRRHLKQKSVDALVQFIMVLAERNSDLFRDLDLAATAEFGDETLLAAR